MKNYLTPGAVFSLIFAAAGLGACAHPAANDGRGGNGAGQGSGDVAMSGQSGVPAGTEMISCNSHAVFFATGSAELDAAAQHNLDQLSVCMRRATTGTITIVGRADASGNAQENVALGQRRGEAMAAYLRAHGVTGVQLTVRSEGGESVPSSEAFYRYERTGQVVLPLPVASNH